MAEIVQFRSRADLAEQFGSRVVDLAEDNLDIDLVTAVDTAIRDLRDIIARWGDEASRLQADECKRMLERALETAC